MKGLLVAATKFEVASAIRYLNKKEDWNVLITGIGGVATTYALAKAIEKNKPDFLLQAGIGGSFNKQLKLGDVVAVGSDCFGDLGVVEGKQRKNIFELGLVKDHQKPFRKGRLVNPHKRLVKLAGMEVMDAVSVNEITTRKADTDYYKNNMLVDIESMEGAAFHYVALMEKIPFLQIRSISNYVGERNKEKWKMQLAISNLNNKILSFIEEMRINNIKLPLAQHPADREIKGGV